MRGTLEMDLMPYRHPRHQHCTDEAQYRVLVTFINYHHNSGVIEMIRYDCSEISASAFN